MMATCQGEGKPCQIYSKNVELWWWKGWFVAKVRLTMKSSYSAERYKSKVQIIVKLFRSSLINRNPPNWMDIVESLKHTWIYRRMSQILSSGAQTPSRHASSRREAWLFWRESSESHPHRLHQSRSAQEWGGELLQGMNLRYQMEHLQFESHMIFFHQ